MAEELVIDTSGVGSESTLRQSQPFGSGVVLRLQNPATFTVEVGGSAVLKITNEGGGVRIDLGESAGERLLLGDSFRAFLNEFLSAKFDAHVHQLPNGQATTPPLPTFTGAQMPEQLLSSSTRAR
jgi:hypothetical protein